jgi:hypothetical protein
MHNISICKDLEKAGLSSLTISALKLVSRHMFHVYLTETDETWLREPGDLTKRTMRPDGLCASDGSV